MRLVVGTPCAPEQLKRLFFLLVAVAVAGASHSVPQQPVLQIDVRSHTAIIRRVDVDAANRFLVTGSDDKTVRVWELPAGRLLRVLRPPIGEGNEGKVFAVAISPDGRTIAAGGWSEVRNHSVYLFDRESGTLRRRIAGHGNSISHLVYSPDGQFLAATLAGVAGLRVYRTGDYTLVGEDRDYKGASYGAAFTPDNRLVTIAEDGFLRLYSGPDFKRARPPTKAPGGEPHGVGVSPDGREVAVGYFDSTRVDILAIADLSLRFSADTTGATNGNLPTVTWAVDGRILYAAGKAQRDGRHFIRQWQNAGRGSYRDLEVAGNTIMALRPLEAGGVVFGSAEPRVGALDGQGRVLFSREPSVLDLGGSVLAVSTDAAEVEFTTRGGDRLSFSVSRRLLGEPRPGSVLQPPRTSAPGLTVTDWKNHTEPKLNGQRLPLDQYEMTRSLAIAPDGSRFLIGAEWSLRLFDGQGKALWPRPVETPGVAWAVNIAPSGEVAVAAFGDGTLRWYRLGDGKELLTLFPHADRQRWVLWSASGYYDAAPGAEDLIGWHVNRGPDAAADFFPVGQFREQYYRPDVLGQMLASLDEAKALQVANAATGRPRGPAPVTAMLPPVVSLLSPSDGEPIASTSLRLFFAIRTPSGAPVEKTSVRLDSRPATLLAEPSQVGTTMEGNPLYEVRVSIPERDAVLEVIATNRFAPSAPAAIRLRWSGPAPLAPPAKLRLWGLAVGVSKYEHPLMIRRFDRLDYAAKDAEDFKATFERQQGLLYETVVIKALPDGHATKDRVLMELEWLERETRPDDVAVIFLSGHAVTDSRGLYYFLPVKADPDQIKSTAIPASDLLNTITALKGKTLVFIDTCKAGAVRGATKGPRPDINKLVNELTSAESGVIVFAASSGDENSLELKDEKNGAFTKALVEGLLGKAAPSPSATEIRILALKGYVEARVKELTQGKQKPYIVLPPALRDRPGYAIAIRPGSP